MSKYECHCCNYKTSRKHDFHKHMGTKRHIRNSQNKDFIPKSENSQPATNCSFHLKNPKILQNPLICEKVKISLKILQKSPKFSDFFSEKNATFRKNMKIHNIHFFPHSPQNIQKVYKSPHNIHFSHILTKYTFYI